MGASLPRGVSFIPNFSSYDVFQEEISRPRGLLHRRNEATVTNANAPLKSPSAKRLSDGNSTADGFACWVHLTLKKRAVGTPLVEVQRVQRLMAVANPLKDGVQAVSTV